MSSSHNILVISDLHLGEDLGASATEACRRDLALAERNLIEFLGYYSRHRTDGLPWRLVINGDMIDFLGITIEADDAPGIPVSAEERVVGLGRREDVAKIQMAAVLSRHVEVFRALARFLAVGNRVDIVCGNHDTELHWPSVQQALCDGLMAAYARGTVPEAVADRIRDGLAFHPWFFHEPGVAWIEHGHQYDECCSYDCGLQPVGPDGALVSNVDTAAMRNITNRIAEADPHGVDEWSFGGYMRFAFGLGPRGALRLAGGYYRFAAQLFRMWRATRSPRLRSARDRLHGERLRALADERSLPEHSLRSIDRLRRRPVVASLRRLAHVLMLDRLSIYACGLLVALTAVLALPALSAVIGAIAAVGTAGVAAHRVTRGRNVDPTVPLQLAPARILSKIDARYAIFGHTHEPEAHALGDGRWYYNTGTWLPTGKPGVLRTFTHVVIRYGHAGRAPEASLCQWRDGKSRAFTPHWSPAPGDVATDEAGVRAPQPESAPPAPISGLAAAEAARLRAA